MTTETIKKSVHSLMKKSVHSLIEEAIVENNPNLNVKNIDEAKVIAKFLFDKVCEKIDFTEYDEYRTERKIRVIKKSIQMRFRNF